jgi:hypothetical protein
MTVTNTTEYAVSIPTMYVKAMGETAITIGMSKVGGGTIGIAYANGSWEYAVNVNGVTAIEGNDLRSGAMGATHEEMARTLASFLGAAGESLYLADMSGRESEYAGEYDDDARAFLVAEYERLSAFADGIL